MVRRLPVSMVLFVAMLCFATSAEDAKVKVELKDMKKQTTLVVKKTIKHADIAATLGAMYGKVGMALGKNKIAPANAAPMARYSKSATEGMLDIEGGFIVPEGSKGDGEVVVSEVPGGKIAFTVHTGPYENLTKTYDAMKAALAEKGLKETNISWEIYISDPGNTKPEELKTEVYLLTEPKK